jgi:DNA-binding MarR family transcriptional regulator
VDRLAEAGLVVRTPDPGDRRRVRLDLTAAAEQCLGALSSSHLEELERMRPALLEILNQAGSRPGDDESVERQKTARA